MTPPCQSTLPAGGGEYRWSDHLRGADKTRLFRYIAAEPYPRPLTDAVAKALGTTADDDSYAADRRLAERFFRGSDLFRVTKPEVDYPVWSDEGWETAGGGGDMLYIAPEPEAQRLYLTANQRNPPQGAKPADSGGGGVSNGAGKSGEERVDIPKVEASGILRRHYRVDDDEQRGLLVEKLGVKRSTTDGRYLHLQDWNGIGPDILSEWTWRFNDPGNAAEKRATIEEAFAEASRRGYRRAQMWTLTTHDARYGSPWAAAEGFAGDLARFKKWLVSRFDLDGRPPTVVVREFTDAGYLHAHVVIFGAPTDPYLPHAVLDEYWNTTRDRGHVHYANLACAGGVWRWDDPPDDAGGRQRWRPVAYLRKSVDVLHSLASASADEVVEAAAALRGQVDDAAAREQGREWWKCALYWALEQRLYTLSPVLRPSDEDVETDESESLPSLTSYRVVGVARYEDFPAHTIRESWVFHRDGRVGPPKPPPAEAGPRGKG